MKKFLIILSCLFCSVSGFAWVFTTEAVELDRKAILLSKLLSAQPLGVCIHVKHRDAGGDCTTKNCADIHASTRAVFESAYQNWFDTLRTSILHSGRRNEFADILAILPQKLNFVYYNGAENNFASCDYRTFGEKFAHLDLILYPFDVLTQYGAANIEGGHYNHSGDPTRAMAKPILDFHYNEEDFGLPGYPLKNGQKNKKMGGVSNRSTYHIMQHELGHTLGLGDLYKEAIGNSYNSRLYSTHQYIPGPNTPAIMSREIGLTCDDMDGLINLLDHYYADTKLKNSVRRQKGWLSLCADKNIAYAYALPFSVTNEEKNQYRLFASQAYGPEKRPSIAPCADKVRSIYEQTAQGQQERETRQAIADSLLTSRESAAQALQAKEQAEKQKRISEQNKNALTCPICGKKVMYADEKSLYNANLAGVGYQVHVHSACDETFRQGKVTSSIFKKYGKPLK